MRARLLARRVGRKHQVQAGAGVVDFGSVSIGIRDIVDIFLVTLLLYQVIILLKGTRAIAAVWGILALLLLHFFSGFFGISTLNWLLDGFLSYLFLVVIIVFQRDIRFALTTLGSRQRWFFWHKRHAGTPWLEELCAAASYMSKHRIGALIVFERGVPLGDISEKAVMLNAVITKELLGTIFWPGSPLHDGAVIISDNKVMSAGCILPLASGVQGKQDYGTRHRAALGITEESDAVALVISEEKGSIRLAEGGHLSGVLEGDVLSSRLEAAMEKRR